jgi:hypothetical protein
MLVYRHISIGNRKFSFLERGRPVFYTNLLIDLGHVKGLSFGKKGEKSCHKCIKKYIKWYFDFQTKYQVTILIYLYLMTKFKGSK